MNSLLRVGLSFLAASVLVFFATGIILRLIAEDDPEPPAYTNIASARDVTVLSQEQLRAILRREGRLKLERPEPPVKSQPPRQVSGFVQLAFTVNPDGSVSKVSVIGAVPEGYYEQQAREIIQARRYTPKIVNGQPVARQHTDIIDFSMPIKEKSGTEEPGTKKSDPKKPGPSGK